MRLGERSVKIIKTFRASLFESFLNHANAAKCQSLLGRVFADRKPRAAESVLKIGRTAVLGRMSVRSIRILDERFILVLFEDFTPEKKQLALNRKQQEALRREVNERQLSEQAARRSECEV